MRYEITRRRRYSSVERFKRRLNV